MRCDYCQRNTGTVRLTAICDPGCEPIMLWLHAECADAFSDALEHGYDRIIADWRATGLIAPEVSRRDAVLKLAVTDKEGTCPSPLSAPS